MNLLDHLTAVALMSCPCGKGDYDLCEHCPYRDCPLHGQPGGRSYVFVVAGSEAQFRSFLRVNHVPAGKAVYVDRQEQLRGHRGSYYVTIGDYASRPDWTYLSSMITHMELVKLPCTMGCVSRG